MNNIAIKINENDNVAVIVNPSGLPAGTVVCENIELLETIPQGHKVALIDIQKGEEIIRYGEVIGIAMKDLPRGSWLAEHNILMPEARELNEVEPMIHDNPTYSTKNKFTFKGYKNSDGSVGTRNVLGIVTSVQCVAGVAEHIAGIIREKLLPDYKNVDGVIPVTHAYGCGVAINAPDAKIPIRSLHNILKNPNFGGAAMILGLGCEKLEPSKLVDQDTDLNNTLVSLQNCEGGFEGMVSAALKIAKEKLEILNKRQRETCPASDLVIGLQCGGSDAFSGITANPAVGFAADMLVNAGGTVLFSEVTEVRDSVQTLLKRALNQDVGQAIIREMKWYDNYLEKGGVDRSANTTPGNKQGGLSNIVEKSLGSIIKSGSTPIVDVLSHGEKIRTKGLIYAATPANDFVCGTQQLASGITLQVFTTGRGTPYNLPLAPVIKVSSRTSLSDSWFDLIDLDAGRIATGVESIESVGRELLEMILQAASGEYITAADKLNLFNDLSVFNPAPMT